MTGTLRGTLKNYVTLHSTLTGETMSVEQFRIVVRDLEKERGFKPIASIYSLLTLPSLTSSIKIILPFA